MPENSSGFLRSLWCFSNISWACFLSSARLGQTNVPVLNDCELCFLALSVFVPALKVSSSFVSFHFLALPVERKKM